jgi:hypothetical protein
LGALTNLLHLFLLWVIVRYDELVLTDTELCRGLSTYCRFLTWTGVPVQPIYVENSGKLVLPAVVDRPFGWALDSLTVEIRLGSELVKDLEFDVWEFSGRHEDLECFAKWANLQSIGLSNLPWVQSVSEPAICCKCLVLYIHKRFPHQPLEQLSKHAAIIRCNVPQNNVIRDPRELTTRTDPGRNVKV